MGNGITRRGFLQGLFGTAAAIAAPAVLVPERRIWSVGANLKRSEGGIIVASDHLTISRSAGNIQPPFLNGSFEQMEGRTHRHGLRPIEGQPGLFEDLSTGQIIHLENDRSETITIPQGLPEGFHMTITEKPSCAINTYMQSKRAAAALPPGYALAV